MIKYCKYIIIGDTCRVYILVVLIQIEFSYISLFSEFFFVLRHQ